MIDEGDTPTRSLIFLAIISGPEIKESQREALHQFQSGSL
jgi:hypothetical protein